MSQYYKDTQGLLHYLDDISFINLLPEGCVAITPEEALVIQNPPITAAEQNTLNESAIQAALDTMAQTRGYSDIKSACAYASSVPFVTVAGATADQVALVAQQEKFRLEGNALQQWMSLTWATAYAYEAIPTNTLLTQAQAVALMPTFTWPD